MKKKSEKIIFGRNIILQLRSIAEYYPRQAIDVVHLVTFEGITWLELGITHTSFSELFETTWRRYINANNDELKGFEKMVIDDFEAQVSKSLNPEFVQIDSQIYHVQAAA